MEGVQVNTQGGMATNAISPNEVLKATDKKPRKKRESRKLTWNERQYGAGFINGMWCGIAVGFPLAAGVAALCKVFVGWLMAW